MVLLIFFLPVEGINFLSIEYLFFTVIFHSFYKINEANTNNKKKRRNLKDNWGWIMSFPPTRHIAQVRKT